MSICHQRIDSLIVQFIDCFLLLNLLMDLFLFLVILLLLLHLLILHNLQLRLPNRLLVNYQHLWGHPHLLGVKLLNVVLQNLTRLEICLVLLASIVWHKLLFLLIGLHELPVRLLIALGTR